MPEFLAPGVFIEEIERGPKPIEGVPTSTAAFLGETERGPLMPRLVTSYAEYQRMFGNVFAEGKYMPHAVRVFFDNGGRRLYIARIVGPGAVSASATLGGFTLTAIGPGAAANRTWVRIGPGTVAGFRLRLFFWDREAVPFDPVDDPKREPRPSTSEEFENLSLDEKSPDYWGTRVNGHSLMARLSVDAKVQLPAEQGAPLTGGTDGNAVTPAQYLGANDNPSARTGLSALELDSYGEVAVIHAPAADKAVVDLIVAHCERVRFRFAVIDGPPNAAAAMLDPRSDHDTSYAAFYYPWLSFIDPETGAQTKTPPGGAVCGVYARTDTQRGVFKAPANEVVFGAVELASDIDQRTQELLNPRGVNVIRQFTGRGILVWGARTLSSDQLWKYVPVRRLLIYLEASIYNGTQWVVFEPNDYKLWARVEQTVTLFLRTEWRNGALLGSTEEQAFYISVGRETMTEDDILNGRLIIEIGIAPVRPAEFVVFRIFQKTAEAMA